MSVVPMTPSMRLTPRPADSCRKGRVTTGILDGPVAQADRIDARLPDLGLLSARKRALHLLEAELFRELRVEPELRTTSIDEEGDFVPAIDAHVDDGQRASVHCVISGPALVAMPQRS